MGNNMLQNNQYSYDEFSPFFLAQITITALEYLVIILHVRNINHAHYAHSLHI